MGQHAGRMKTSKADSRRYKRDEHVMGQPEAKVCRRLMAETGLNEEQLREHKKYRKMLSDAQFPGNTHSVRQNFFARQEQQKIDTSAVYASTKDMFMQLATQLLDGDKKMAARLYKRYAGGLVDAKRPSAFHYRILDNKHNKPADVLRAVDKADGMFSYSPERGDIGFMYESSMLMFTLAHEIK